MDNIIKIGEQVSVTHLTTSYMGEVVGIELQYGGDSTKKINVDEILTVLQNHCIFTVHREGSDTENWAWGEQVRKTTNRHEEKTNESVEKVRNEFSRLSTKINKPTIQNN